MGSLMFHSQVKPFVYIAEKSVVAAAAAMYAPRRNA